jgi:hypothetical protein
VVDLSTSVQATIFSQLPASDQALVAQAQQLYSTAEPALSLAATIGSGGQPSFEEGVAGLAAVGTVAMGPLAGAAIGAIGLGVEAASDAMKAVIDALGLGENKAPSWSYNGLLRIGYDAIPYGPKDVRNWIDISTAAKADHFRDYGDATHPGLSGHFDGGMWAVLVKAFVCKAHPANAFEAFLAQLVIDDLQLWANCQGYIPPERLLVGAVQAWNASHGSSPSITYSGPPGTTAQVIALQSPGGEQAMSLAELILGPEGQSVTIANGHQYQDQPPISVNLGPPKATPMTVNINPLTFGKGTGSPSTNRGILEAALYWATGTSYANASTADIDAAIAGLRATGISQAKFDSLTHAGQVIINEAQIPVQMNVGGAFRPAAAAPAPSGSGISSGMVALGVLAVAGGLAAWKFYQNRQGV